MDGTFAVCTNTPAVPYEPGLSVVSRSGAWRAELVSASTDTSTGTVDGAAIGTSTWMVELAEVPDAGASDAGAPDGGADPQVAAEKPYMPLHQHGASVVPAVAANGGGSYTISDIDFIMSGYWQVTLDLGAGAGSDTVVFEICIPP